MAAPEGVLAAVAARQDDIVARAQLLQAGLTRAEIDGRLRRGQLRRRHRGVYLTGYAQPPLRGCARAALLACGPDAIASHSLAAALWGLPVQVAAEQVDVTVIGRNPGRKPGIGIH